MKSRCQQSLLGSASLLAIAAALAAPAKAQTTTPYLAGDFHNHTTCSDGATAIPTIINQGVSVYGLEWFAQSGHGGAFARDCRFNDPEYDASLTGEGKLFIETIGVDALQGNPTTSNTGTGSRGQVRAMWKWQSLQDNVYPLVVAQQKGRAVFAGLEQNVPGHEHADTSIITGQLPRARGAVGNVLALSEYEYRFDRNDNDTSGGNGNWTGKQLNTGLVGNAAHAKAVTGVAWMQANYPLTAYMIMTHPERNGPFSPTGNNGTNIEHFRDFNNAGPTVSFGFDSQPGHQADSDRGAYGTGSVGAGTRGGTGVYSAVIGGLWDALLGEGRNFWLFANSDFHNRGTFGPFEQASTADLWPGEHQRTFLPPGSNASPQKIVDGLRAGNTFNVMGDLITKDFTFTACAGTNCATMGQTLVVPPGSPVTVTMTVTLPTGANFSPYSFPNPVLRQIGLTQPINQPVLDHIDLIGGAVTGVVDPSSPNYTVPSNPSAAILQYFPSSSFAVSGQTRTITYNIPSVTSAQYVRARGTNVPVGTPNATDSVGNPLNDFLISANVPCLDSSCPAHMPVKPGIGKVVDTDVRAWSTLWFYANPIFIRPSSSPELLVETNAKLVRSLAGLSP